MEFSRQEYWSGFPFHSPGDLPDPGIELGYPPHCKRILYCLSTTFIWILTVFLLSVKHCDTATFCLGKAAYQTSHQGRMTVKDTHFLFQDKKTDRLLLQCKWADWQALTPPGRLGKGFDYGAQEPCEGSRHRSVNPARDYRLDLPSSDLRLHSANEFLQPKWEKNKTKWVLSFKALLYASNFAKPFGGGRQGGVGVGEQGKVIIIMLKRHVSLAFYPGNSGMVQRTWFIESGEMI